jgi:hypothetical protein
MSHLNQTLVTNFFGAIAEHDEKRMLRAPQSEKQFWIGRAASNRAAGKSANLRAVEFILKLRRNHCSNPLFATLCQNMEKL